MNIQAKAYPNPFTSSLSVEAHCDADAQVIFRLLNETGHLMKMTYWKLLKGNNKLVLDSLHNLAIGSYSVEIKNEDNQVLHKFDLVKK